MSRLHDGRYAIIPDLQDDMKVCRYCNEAYPDSLIHFTKTPKGVTSNQCRPCAVKRSAKWRRENAERARRNDRSKLLQKKFGITLQHYNSMAEAQQHCCAICGQPESVNLKGGLTSHLAVDHCHKTGKIRGLLCFKCNTALAQFEARLDKLAAYLESNQ